MRLSPPPGETMIQTKPIEEGVTERLSRLTFTFPFPFAWIKSA